MANNFFFLIVASLALTAYAGELVQINNPVQCDGLTTIKAVYVEDCTNGEMCDLVKGHNYSLKITYTAPKDVQTAKALVTGVIGGAELPFPGLQRYVCKTPGNEDFCPQVKGKDYTVSMVLPIMSLFPKLETTATVRFIDDDAKSEAEEKLGCFQLPIRLVDDPNAPKQPTRVDNEDDDE